MAELLFDDERPPVADDPVAKRARSPQAKRKEATETNRGGRHLPLLPQPALELALVVRNSNRAHNSNATFDTTAKSNPTQTRALELIELIPKHAESRTRHQLLAPINGAKPNLCPSPRVTSG